MRRLVLLLVLAACVRAPSPAPSAGAAPWRGLVIAHRGFSWEAPEHTMAAYGQAVAAGADYIEQDLQFTADAQLLVLHDETGARTLRGAGCDGEIATQPLRHWQQCDAGSWFNERAPDRRRAAYADERPPVLRAVLQRYPAARFYIETKAPDRAPGMEDSLVAELTRAGLRTPDAVRARRVLLQSFSAASIRRLATLAPELPRVQLLERGELAASGDVDGALARIAQSAGGIGPSRLDVTPALVRAAHAHCLVVHPYTVNEPAEMRRLAAAGVDGMFSDRPNLVRQATAGEAPAPFPPHCEGR
ncbi:MAG: glycerophosphodiester phosphodiesterase family protein [Gemmatimonadaceae bacterium]|nr:glycerophosphodiester phosphodiesterase family protein [Gemmatimonadaceae bacterium]